MQFSSDRQPSRLTDQCWGRARRATAAGLAILFTCAQVQADPLDDYIRARMESAKIPAVVYGVIKDGRVLRSGAYGLADVELNVKANVDSVFEIGSVSKQFTATLVLMLMEAGRLSLDDRVDKYLSDLPEAWRAVTLKQLLNHTSGIPDFEEIFGYDSYRNIYTAKQIIDIANSKPMMFEPGAKWYYTNTGYYLLALVLEKIEGRTYDELLRTRIFEPLGMTRTRQSDPFAVIPNRAKGYQLSGGKLAVRDAMQPSACLGAGTIVSTIRDMAKWDEAIQRNRLIKPATQRSMWEPTKLPNGTAGYGLGWFVGDWRGHKVVEHSGGTAGFSCDYKRFQDLGLSVVVFTNLYATGVGGVAIRAADAIHPGLSYASAKPLPENPRLKARLLEALNHLAAGGQGSPHFTPALWGAFPDQGRAAWRKRLDEMKSFDLIVQQKHAPKPAFTDDLAVETVVYRMVTGGQTVYVTFMFTEDARLAGMGRSDF